MKTFAITALLALGFTSCNTFIGVGRDMRQLGKGMEHTAHGRPFDGNDTSSSGTEPQPAPDETLPTY